jgi:hypothetical protein
MFVLRLFPLTTFNPFTPLNSLLLIFGLTLFGLFICVYLSLFLLWECHFLFTLFYLFPLFTNAARA